MGLYDKLVLGGGGIKGIMYLGLISYLEDNDIILDDIIEYVGTSIGAFVCLLLNLKYSSDELVDIFFNLDFNSFNETSLKNFIDNYGFSDGNKLEEFIKTIISNKGYKKNITFIELYNLTGKSLVTSATCIKTRDTVYFNKDLSPDTPVYLAVRISMNIPFIFQPVFYTGTYYVDGGLSSNLPIRYYTNNDDIAKTLCVKLSNNKLNDYDESNTTFIYYTMNIIKTLQKSIEKRDSKYCSDNKCPLLILETSVGKTIDFNVSLYEKETMFSEGLECSKKFFE